MKVLVQLVYVQELQEFDNSDFKKQTAIFQSNETGTPFKVEFQNDKIELLNDILIGQTFYLSFKISGFYYDKKDNKGKPTGKKDVSNPLVASALTLIN